MFQGVIDRSKPGRAGVTRLQLRRAPYSKTVIEELRSVPWASWDPKERVWRVPFRSLEPLRERWLAIEIAARRAEPSERKRRREELKASPEFAEIREREAERRRRRYPVPSSELPPPGRPVMTAAGIIVVTGSDGELVDVESAAGLYPQLKVVRDPVWVFWRLPSLQELFRTWPAKRLADEAELARGWWQPTIEDLREALRKTRSIEQSTSTRMQRAG